MKVPQLEDLPDPSGKRVLLRADFNVPITDGRIDDDLRIRATLPTIEWLWQHGVATITACSHLGRPRGKPDPRYSIEPVRARLAELGGALDAEAWGALDDEARYVLTGLAGKKREPERFAAAVRELGIGLIPARAGDKGPRS